MSDATTDPGHQSPAEIEREVDERRRDLTDSVNALQNRLSVETIVDDIMKSVSKNGGEVSRNLGRTVRDNPVPLLLTGIGLAWLMASSNGSKQQTSTYDDDRFDTLDDDAFRDFDEDPVSRDRVYDTGSDVGTESGVSDTRSASSYPVGTTATRSSSFGSSSGDDATPGRTERARRSVQRMGDDVGGRYDRARSGAMQAGSDIGDRASRFMDDQPLIVAALGVATGLAIGGLLPRSQMEDDAFGEQSDEAIAAARQSAGEQVDKARAVAGAVADEAKTMGDEAAGGIDRQTSSGDEMVGQAKSGAKSAVNRLKDAGEAEVNRQDRSDRSI